MRLRPALGLAFSLLVAFGAAYALLWSQDAARAMLCDLSFWVFSGVAAAALFHAAQSTRAAAPAFFPAWLSLAFSQLLFAFGDATWAANALMGVEDPYPSLADLFYVASYAPFVAAPFLLPGPLVHRHDRAKIAIDLALIVVAVAAALFSAGNLLDAPLDGAASSATLTLLYVALDIAVVVAIALVLLSGHGHGDNLPLLLLVLGGGARAVMDALLGYRDLICNPVSGGLDDFGWLVSYLLIGLAGAVQADDARAGRIHARGEPKAYGEVAWGRYLPHLAALTAFACLLWKIGTARTPPVTLGFAVGVVLVLATLREWLIGRDNLRLAAAARRELAERRQADERLRVANEDLDRRVQERTRALHEANESLRAEIAEHTRVEDQLRVRDFALASSLNAIALTDLDGRITYVNPAFTAMWRCEPADALGRPLIDFWFSRDAALTVLATVRDTGRWDGEARARRPNGEGFDVQVAASIVRDANRRPVSLMALFLDITLRRRTDAAFLSRLRYEEAIADCAAILLGNTAGTAPLQSVMNRLLQVSGASRVYFFENFADPEDGLCTRQACEACAPGVDPQMGNAALQHFPYRHGFQRWVDDLSHGRPIAGRVGDFPNGERPILESQAIASILVLPIIVNGRWHGFLGFDDTVHDRRWAAEDVRLLETAARLIAGYIERQGAMAAMVKSVAQWQTTFNSVADGICLLDIAQRVEQCNDAFARLVAVPREACIGRHCWELVHGSHQPVDECPVVRAARSLRREEMELTQDGRRYEVVADPLVDPRTGRYCGAVHTVRDITERRRAEEERRQLQAQVLHSQKLDSLGLMAAGIAHDFNNILTTILGNADLALAEQAVDAPMREHLGAIDAAGRRAADLCRQLLAYSGRGRFVVTRIDLNALLRDMEPLVAVSVSRKATVEYAMADALPSVEGDVSQIRQVILNLVLNASEALPEGAGVVRIAMRSRFCGAHDVAAVESPEGFAEGEYAVIEVTDNGCGIAPEVMPRVFDPFFTTKFTGRGLGLPAALGIVRGHRGAIEMDSRPGAGTTVRVYLPAVAAAPAEATEVRLPAEPQPGWRGAGTVLVADDEPTLRLLAGRMLTGMGFAVVEAADGREAVDLFAERQHEIVCVLLDLTMPRMDGEQAFREIRQLSAAVPVILCSGYSETEVLPRFAGKGLAGFLQKPYRSATLAAKLREVLPPGTPAPPPPA